MFTQATSIEVLRIDAPRPHDSEKTWSRAFADGLRAPLLLTLAPSHPDGDRPRKGDTQQAALTPVSTTEISFKMEVTKAAELLVTRHGLKAALKTAANEKSSARRARGARRFQFWTAIASEIEARAHDGFPNQ